MGKNSHRGYTEAFELTSWNALERDEPMSAYQAWVIRNNIQHNLDQSGQYRINWVAAANDFTPRATSEGRSGRWRWVFPITSIRRERPMNLDIRAATIMTGGAGEVDIALRLYPRKSPGSEMWSTSANVTTTGAHWAIDTLATWTNEARHKQGRLDLTSVDNDSSSEPSTSFLDVVTLELDLVMPDSETGTVRLCGLQVREYP